MQGTMATLILIFFTLIALLALGILSASGFRKTLPPLELITDELIKQEACHGSHVKAMAMYRIKYGTGLKKTREAIDAVKDAQ